MEIKRPTSILDFPKGTKKNNLHLYIPARQRRFGGALQTACFQIEAGIARNLPRTLSLAEVVLTMLSRVSMPIVIREEMLPPFRLQIEESLISQQKIYPRSHVTAMPTMTVRYLLQTVAADHQAFNTRMYVKGIALVSIKRDRRVDLERTMIGCHSLHVTGGCRYHTTSTSMNAGGVSGFTGHSFLNAASAFFFDCTTLSTNSGSSGKCTVLLQFKAGNDVKSRTKMLAAKLDRTRSICSTRVLWPLFLATCIGVCLSS